MQIFTRVQIELLSRWCTRLLRVIIPLSRIITRVVNGWKDDRRLWISSQGRSFQHRGNILSEKSISPCFDNVQNFHRANMDLIDHPLNFLKEIKKTASKYRSSLSTRQNRQRISNEMKNKNLILCIFFRRSGQIWRESKIIIGRDRILSGVAIDGGYFNGDTFKVPS